MSSITVSLSRMLRSVAVVALICVATVPVLAQSDHQPSRWEVLVGYSYLDPNGQVLGTELESAEKGFIIDVSYFFNRYAGIKFDTSAHVEDFYSLANVIQVGPTFRLPVENAAFFAHGLVGWSRMGVSGFNTSNTISVTAGGGFDLRLTERLSWRVLQGDLNYARHKFAPANVARAANLNAARISSGLVFHIGSFAPPVPPSASCAVQPTEIFPGEPVRATVTTANFNPKRTLSYTWSSTGGRAEGTNENANIDTNGLAPGSYTVTARVTDGRKANAECTANFTVKQYNAPTISCAANPATVQPGGTATITSTASSPHGFPLTYSYRTSGGSITGEGQSVTLNTEGAAPGTVTVNCDVRDEKGLTASTTTSVTVEAPPPPPPPAPETSRLNEISFARNNARVDNAAKAVLDDVALRLQRDADARLVIVGGTEEGERGRNLAAQRAINARTYLVDEKGIDASRIEVRTGGTGTRAEMYLVPAGANFEVEGTTVVDESALKGTRRRR